MARWKLREAHYLNVPGTVWEQVETDRESGRQKRKSYPVPLYLNPNDPADWSHRPGMGHVLKGGNSFEEGSIIVAYEGQTRDNRDIIFVGDPTPGMEPLDDEAVEISSRYNWGHPIEDLNTTFSEAKLSEVRELFADAVDAATKAATSAPKQNEQMMAMQQQMVEMMGQMTSAMTMMMGAIQQMGSQPARRV